MRGYRGFSKHRPMPVWIKGAGPELLVHPIIISPLGKAHYGLTRKGRWYNLDHMSRGCDYFRGDDLRFWNDLCNAEGWEWHETMVYADRDLDLDDESAQVLERFIDGIDFSDARKAIEAYGWAEQQVIDRGDW